MRLRDVMGSALSYVLAQAATPDAGTGGGGGGGGLLATLGGVAGVIAIAALVFDNGILVKIWNAWNRRYKWDAPPALEPTGKVTARISHGYEENRTLTMAVVVVAHRLLFRIVWRIWHPRTPAHRWIVVANLLDQDETRTLEPNQGTSLDGALNNPSALPTWRIWQGMKRQNPAGRRRLMFLARFDRKGTIASRVEKLSGATKPLGS